MHFVGPCLQVTLGYPGLIERVERLGRGQAVRWKALKDKIKKRFKLPIAIREQVYQCKFELFTQ